MNKNTRKIQPPEDLDSSSQRLLTWTICAWLVLAVFAVFGQTIGHEFILCDDNIYVENGHVSKGLTGEGFWWACTTTYAGNWHPLTWLSHMIDVQCFGGYHSDGAGGHHIVNVFLHAISTVLLFLTLRMMTGTLWRSALVAALFAIHPLRAESVAWVAERKDVLSGMFWMLTMFAYAWYVKKLRFDSSLAVFLSLLRYLAVFFSLAVGLSSKSMLVTLPCVLLLLDYWPLGRWRWRDNTDEAGTETPNLADRPVFQSLPKWWLLVEKLPLLALSAVVSNVVVYAQETSGAMNMTDPVPYGYRVSNALVSSVMYLWKTIWPENLAFFYPHPAILGKDPLWWTVLQAVVAGLILAAITLFVIWNVRRRPYLSVGWFWYLGTLVPVIGLIQVGIQGMADRYTYIPTIGIYILVVWGAVEAAASHARFRVALQYGTPILLVLLMVVAGIQVHTWCDSMTLFKHAIDVTKDNYFAYNHYGLAFDSPNPDDPNKNLEKAGEQYKKSQELAPKYDSANSNLGSYYAKKGNFDKAIEYYQKAIEVNRFFFGARANLGNAYFNIKQFDKAIATYRDAIELADRVSADSPEYHKMIAVCLIRKGQPANLDEAIVELRKAIEMWPQNGDYHRMLIGCLFEIKKPQEAMKEFRDLVEKNPQYLDGQNEYALKLATFPDASVRNGKEAIEHARKALELAGSEHPVILRTLAAAYAEAGQFPEALQTARRALQIAKQLDGKPLVKDLEGEINLYKLGIPLRIPETSLVPKPKRP